MEPWGAQVDKSTTKLMFSSKSNDWATPQSFFDKLNGVFGPFTLDAAASADNYKVANHYTEADNALVQDWSGNRVFLNPPYGRGLKDWIKKGYEEGQKDDTTVVMLIPARTDTKWFHEIVMPNAYLVYLIKGRFNFSCPGHVENANAPFPNMLILYRKHKLPVAGITTLNVPKEARGFP